MSFEDANRFFRRAMEVGRTIEALLVTPDRSVSVKISLKLDDGTIGSSRATTSGTTTPAARARAA